MGDVDVGPLAVYHLLLPHSCHQENSYQRRSFASHREQVVEFFRSYISGSSSMYRGQSFFRTRPRIPCLEESLDDRANLNRVPLRLGISASRQRLPFTLQPPKAGWYTVRLRTRQCDGFYASGSPRTRAYHFSNAAPFLCAAGGSLHVVPDYKPITDRERLEWFLVSTAGPSSLFGAGPLSAGLSTAFNKPPEYGPHWEGFGKRYGMRLTGISTGNAIEATLGTVRRYSRYFPSPNRAFGARVKYIIKTTFLAPRRDGRWRLAYARYAGN